MVHPLKTRLIANCKQRGAALLVMMLILVLGAATYLVSSLNSSTVNIARDMVTADALAQAKAALIGYAASDSNYPGDLPCPDVNDDGKLTMNVDYIGSSCTSPIGRLPWITLGLPELRDGAGEHLWYAVSKNFWAMGTPTINSDTAGDLSITDATTGTTIANNVIAIVFAPGNTLSGQSRSPTQAANCTTTGDTAAATYESLCATNYVEGSNPDATWNKLTASSTAINTGYQTSATSSSFNDQLIYITHDQLLAPVEMRIAREAKKCLDDYAATSANKYPWAVPVYETAASGVFDTFFGRISDTPNIDTTASGVPDTPAMSSSWPASCSLFSSTSWTNSWRNEVFYQVADGNQPDSIGNCVPTSTCLYISGSGNISSGSGTYRAVVIVARKAIGTENRSITTTDPPTPYLEGTNAHSGVAPATTFETYKSTDTTNYSNVNDLVLCVDGKVNCQ